MEEGCQERGHLLGQREEDREDGDAEWHGVAPASGGQGHSVHVCIQPGSRQLCSGSAHGSAFIASDGSQLSFCTRDCVLSPCLWKVVVLHKSEMCDSMSPACRAAVGEELTFRLPVLARRASAWWGVGAGWCGPWAGLLRCLRTPGGEK